MVLGRFKALPASLLYPPCGLIARLRHAGLPRDHAALGLFQWGDLRLRQCLGSVVFGCFAFQRCQQRSHGQPSCFLFRRNELAQPAHVSDDGIGRLLEPLVGGPQLAA